jgi:hypothetical protein
MSMQHAVGTRQAVKAQAVEDEVPTTMHRDAAELRASLDAKVERYEQAIQAHYAGELALRLRRKDSRDWRACGAIASAVVSLNRAQGSLRFKLDASQN